MFRLHACGLLNSYSLNNSEINYNYPKAIYVFLVDSRSFNNFEVLSERFESYYAEQTPRCAYEFLNSLLIFL